MHLSPILLPALLLAVPLSAQTAGPITTLSSGRAVRVQWRGDTAWHEVEVAWIDGPTGNCYGARLPPPEPGDDGFIVQLFSAATAIAVRDAGGSWTELPPAELREIQGCGTGRIPTPDARCGAAPQLAKFTVAGGIYGGRMNAGSGGPWDEFISLENADLAPLTAADRCEAILRAATGPRAAPDSLPLRGIVALGDLGFAVVRGTEPTGPSGRTTTAITLLDPKLQVLRGWQSAN